MRQWLRRECFTKKVGVLDVALSAALLLLVAGNIEHVAKMFETLKNYIP